MKLQNTVTTANLPPKGKRAYRVSNANKGTIVRSKKAHRHRHSRAYYAHAKALWGCSQRKWRQHWHGFIARMWKHTLVQQDRDFWIAQAELVAFYNYKNLTGIKTGFQFFVWYQLSVLDTFVKSFRPDMLHKEQFPFIFIPPWSTP